MAPATAVSPWLARYWEFSVHQVNPPPHHVPPDGGTSILVATGPLRDPVLQVSGPWLEPLVVPVALGDCFWGARLHPGAAREFLGISPIELHNTVRPLPMLFGRSTKPLAVELDACVSLADAAATMDRTFGPAVVDLQAPDPFAADVVAFIIMSRGAIRMAAIAGKLDTSPRTMLRRFLAATGITPKQFARVVRFRFAAMHLIGTDARLSRVAASSGYADQPHLTREWADLLGITPSRLAQVIRATAHDNITL